MDITACPWGVLLEITSIAQGAFVSSRETQMPYADYPTPLDRYAARVKEAACQYRRDCSLLSEVNAYARLKSEQERAMRELVTGEYWRMIAVRAAPQGTYRVMPPIGCSPPIDAQQLNRWAATARPNAVR
jgi:hypothetical protein